MKYIVPAIATLAVAAFVAAPFIGVAEESASADAALAPAEEIAPAEGVEIAPAATAVPAVPAEVTAEQRTLFLQGLGWLIGQQSGLIEDLRIPAADVPAVAEGFRLALLGEGKEFPEKIIALNKEYSAFIQDLLAKAAAAKAAEAKAAAETNKKLGAEFIAAAKAKDTAFVELPSGVLLKIVSPGDETKKPTVDDTVAVRYTGTLIDGTIFDSSNRDASTGEPFPFEAGKGETVKLPLGHLIPAWTEVLPQIGVGGRCTIIAPSETAYGDDGSGPIAPGSTLIFDIELAEIVPAAEAAASLPIQLVPADEDGNEIAGETAEIVDVPAEDAPAEATAPAETDPADAE